MPLRFSLSGHILCNAEGCTAGIPATLLVFVDRPLTAGALLGFDDYSGIAMDRVVPVAPELPEGWTVVKPPHPERQTAWFFCPEHQAEAEELVENLHPESGLDEAEGRPKHAEQVALGNKAKEKG